MGWLIFMMIVVPILGLGTGAAWWLVGRRSKNLLLSGDPEIARLACRAEASVKRLTSVTAVAGLPPTLAQEIRAQAGELVSRVLPELLTRRRSLVERIRRSDPWTLEVEQAKFQKELDASTDPEVRRLLETNIGLTRDRLTGARQLRAELAKVDLSLKALVGNVEALEERYAAGDSSLPGARQILSAGQLLEELKQVQTELKLLGSGREEPATAEPEPVGESAQSEAQRRPIH